MGVLYLIQERELKSRSPRAFYYLAPSLERCDTISGHSVALGFGLLSLAILTGLAWSRTARGRYWSGDPKEWISVLAWVLYVSLIVARQRAGWGGRQAAVLAIVGFSALASIFVWMIVLGGATGAR
jgi:ABC-type transport system involved in cytochrome c biogenesis permease subunit